MDGNIPSQQKNKFLELIQGNEKIVFLAGGMILLLGIIVIAIISMNNAAQPVQPNGVSPTETHINPTRRPIPTALPEPTIIFAPQERVTIITQTKTELDALISVPYTVTQAKGYGEEWAIIEVSNPTTDPANVVIKKENGSWNVKLGPGTSFEEEQLQSIGAPQSLIDEVNGDI